MAADDERFEAVGRDPRFRRFPRRRDRAPGAAGPAGGDERFAGLDAMLRAGRAREGAVDKRGRRQGKQPGQKKPSRPRREPEPAEAAAAEPKKAKKAKKDKKDKKAKRRKAREAAAAEGDPPEGPAPSASFSSGEVGGGPGGPGDAAGGRPDPARERVRGGQGPSAGYAARIRGADGASETTSATSSGLSLDAEDEDALLREAATSKLAEWGVGAVAGGALLGAAEERVPEAAEPTARLAVVDLDWEHVTAQDIFTILHSFLPKGGALTRVTIYPSKYGLERMAQEARHGPQGIFEAKAGGGGDGDGDGVREEGFSDSEAPSSSSGEGDVDNERLRDYERAKLRYYYGVAECDSAATAAKLYAECDGLEFEHSANKLDLRFVGAGQTFTAEPKDVATGVEAGYRPLDFYSSSLQHSRVKLSWDMDDPGRKHAFKWGAQAGGELDDAQFGAYLASGSEEEEAGGDGERPQSKIAELLELAAGPGRRAGKNWGAAAAAGAAAADVHMQVSFDGGFDSGFTDKMGRDETVWEASLRRKREQKKERKAREAAGGDGGPRANAESQFDDPFFAEGQPRRAKRAAAAAEPEETPEARERRKAELELLMLDDGDLAKGVGRQGAAAAGYEEEDSDGERDRRRKKRKGKRKGRGEAEEEPARARFDVDLEDPRFQSLFDSHHYALDPTAPQFKATEGTKELLRKVSAKKGKLRRRGNGNGNVAPREAGGAPPDQALKALVGSLKRKSKQAKYGGR